MKFLSGIFLVVLAFMAVNGEELQEDLAGSKVYNVYPTTKKQHLIVSGLEEGLKGVDIWQRPHVLGREARILVPKHAITAFEIMMDSAQIRFEVTIDDVPRMISNEKLINDIARHKALRSSKISFTAYHRHAEINAYLDELAAKYPNKVTVTTIAKTSQGRDLKAIMISTTGGQDASKPVIISDAGIHAREWIAPAVSLYMITKLVEDITESDVSDKLDWIIVPLLNPDGYEYSQTNNRLWRKTRSTAASSSCPGVDGNRNFDFQWMVSGSSSSPCSDIFAGPKAFSEPETAALGKLMAEYAGRAKGYLACHSYGSYFLYPYGYNGRPTPTDAELNSVGKKVAAAIDAAALPGSQKYLVGNSGAALNYLASGASDDYAYAIDKITLAFTLELPGGGSAGFDLPPSRINQVVKESWQGILVLARYIISQNS